MPEISGKRFLLALLAGLICMEVVAQEISSDGSQRIPGISFGVIRHSYVGMESSQGAFDFEGIGYGISYVGPQIRGSALYARSSGGSRLIDLSAMVLLFPQFARVERSRTSIAMPLGALGAWRRTDPNSDADPLTTNAILLGAGVTLSHSFHSRFQAELRVMPFAGITGSEITDAVGFSWAIDSEARLDFEEVFSNLGLSVGYSFRYQLWNINGSGVFSEAVDELYDYAGLAHTMFLGVAF